MNAIDTSLARGLCNQFFRDAATVEDTMIRQVMEDMRRFPGSPKGQMRRVERFRKREHPMVVNALLHNPGRRACLSVIHWLEEELQHTKTSPSERCVSATIFRLYFERRNQLKAYARPMGFYVSEHALRRLIAREGLMTLEQITEALRISVFAAQAAVFALRELADAGEVRIDPARPVPLIVPTQAASNGALLGMVYEMAPEDRRPDEPASMLVCDARTYLRGDQLNVHQREARDALVQGMMKDMQAVHFMGHGWGTGDAPPAVAAALEKIYQHGYDRLMPVEKSHIEKIGGSR